MTLVQVLVGTAAVAEVSERIFAQTTTLGLRVAIEERRIVQRDERQSADGVRVKVASRPGKQTAKSDMDDVAARALDHAERQQARTAAEHHVRGFTNADIRQRLVELKALGIQVQTVQHQSAKVSRLFHRLHVYGLIAKVPRLRRWRISKQGLRVMSSWLRLTDQMFPKLHASVYA